jgi:acyl-CoA synthetase (NDP forming)
MNEKNMSHVEELFNPQSIAVIGAGPNTDSVGGRLIDYLDDHGYNGTIYPVNPSYETVHNRTCYDSVIDLPSSPTHAFILLPAELVEDVVRECGKAGTDYVLIGSSGFSEAGHEYREETIQELAIKFDMRVLGPNCLGIIDTGNDLALSFSSACRLDLKSGGLGIVSQSGSLAGALLQMAQREGVGLSKWMSTGNEVDMSLLDILEYYVESPSVEIAVAFIEGVSDGTRLRRIGRRALQTETPILAIKAGDSDAGQEAISSHTGRISDTSEIYDAAFDETGIIRINSIQEYLDALESFTTIPTNRYPEGSNIGVISASGGACALIADIIERYDMNLPALPDKTREKFAERLPEYGSATNPVDLTGRVITDTEFFGQFVEDLAKSETIDAVLLQFGNTGDEYIRPMREDLQRITAETSKPIITSFAGGWPEEDVRLNLKESGVPVYSDPKPAIKALKAMSQWRQRTQSSPEPLRDYSRGNKSLTNTWEELAENAESVGIDVVDYQTVSTAETAVEAAEELGYPVTIKLDAPDLSHKTEIDGVQVDQRTKAEVHESAESLLETARGHSIADATLLVQEHIEGLEIVCGCLESDEFGPMMIVGAGGVFVELFGDETREYTFLPTSQDRVQEIVSQGQFGEVLDNYRGETLARDKLIETLTNFGNFYTDSNASELEANPIILTGNRATVVDLVVE